MSSPFPSHRHRRPTGRTRPPPSYHKLARSLSGNPRFNYPAFLFLLLAIPLLILLHLPPLLTSPHSHSSQHVRTIPTVPDPLLSTHSEHAGLIDTLPAYSNLAPRNPRFTLVSTRTPVFPQNHHPNLPIIRAVLVCETPCCRDTITPAVTALVTQTLPPTHLTVVHACSLAHFPSFQRQLRHALDDPTTRSLSFSLLPEAVFHACNQSLVESCTLSHLADLAESAASTSSHYSILLSNRVILEHTAVEKAYLSLFVRSHVHVVRFQGFDLDSLKAAERVADPLLIRRGIPRLASKDQRAVTPLPLFYETRFYLNTVRSLYGSRYHLTEWEAVIRLVANARLLREPLHTIVDVGTPQNSALFSFARFPNGTLPPQLFSELAFYKWASRQDREDMYAALSKARPRSPSTDLDLRPIPHRPLHTGERLHVMIIQPWMQLGGSEKCMVDVGRAVLQNGWGLSYLLTMPFWAEDPAGEITLKHEWLSLATELTSDVFDLLSIATDKQATRLFRYLLETRRPDVVLMANSRWAYAHVPLISSVLPHAMIADYNHMVHMTWNGGGMPRYAANASEYFDLHLTASNNVSVSMRRWINPKVKQRNVDRVQTCYIGTDTSLVYTGNDRRIIRSKMRSRFNIPESVTVVLFAGRLVVDKGVDVIMRVMKSLADEQHTVAKLYFVLVGDGDLRSLLTDFPVRPDGSSFIQVHEPAKGLEELRRYYAMADVLLLPSINEGIALVLYEAMASGMLVITTDVGGQRELVTERTGVLLPNENSLVKMGNRTLQALRNAVNDPDKFKEISNYGQSFVQRKFTTPLFKKCVMSNIERAISKKLHLQALQARKPENVNLKLGQMSNYLRYKVQEEMVHGRFALGSVQGSVEGMLTIGIKTYVCDSTISGQVANLVRSIRVKYPRVRVLLGHDGPLKLENEAFVRKDPFTEVISLPADSGISVGRNAMVNLTTTEYFLLLDDDHLFDESTDLRVLLNGIKQDEFHIVGLRVRNLPGIEEYERIGILIPRYVAKIMSLKQRNLKLCVWNENEGPSVFGITHPIRVDVLHNAFLARTDVLRESPWRSELKVNEHMTFFLDAKDSHLRVGYLPSVFVHHRPRVYSDCYYQVRFREDKFKRLLRYEDQFLWDVKCGQNFPQLVRKHIIQKELGE